MSVVQSTVSSLVYNIVIVIMIVRLKGFHTR